ncbi:Hypothetical predicted protein [Mytilus galloprovincialis]|uniref:Fibronectin type-III domain-containing protein n=1 Tax=Mytilus galloprovincialis TaxID=29158 RepID=A0A8B6D708_MYTGA|nr:Hypothetical predicted protein [Mytilus galloprovincialis]
MILLVKYNRPICEGKTTIYFPTAPKEFDIIECTESSITIGWIIDESNECPQYEIAYQLQGTDDWKGLILSTEDVLTVSNKSSYELQKLLPETMYEVKMRTIDNHLNSQYTECKEKQTLKLGKGTSYTSLTYLFQLMTC